MNQERSDHDGLVVHNNKSSEDLSREEVYALSNYSTRSSENEYNDYRLSDVTVEIHPDDANFTFKKCAQFIGPGFLVSVGYLDPGNWATDIAGGSQFGYKLIWVLFMSNVMALCLQTLAARLGLVTERDLAQCCRYKYPRKVCMVLWFLTEIAIAATDLAEVLGTAIGLELLIGLPLIFGVLFTVCDTLIFLLVQKYGIRKLEALIFSLLSFITLCFIVELFLSKPQISSVIMGFIPTIDSESLFIAMGMLGATVMPHNFYLHSSLVQSRKFGRSSAQIKQACFYNLIDSAMALNVAFFVNGSILVVAAAVFYAHGLTVTELEDAHGLLEGFVHSAIAPFMFGLGLFCAGQSSTLTGTMAGQIVMEGFLQMKMVPWLRRLITRCVAVVPAAIVIAIMGNAGTYRLLILSQVVLSLQLPFAIVPLIKFTSDKKLMNEFVSPVWLIVISWFFAAIIISLNMWMVYDNLYTMYTYSEGTRLIATFFFVPLSMGLMALLLYLTVDGTFLLAPLERFFLSRAYTPLQHYVSAIDLTELSRKESETVA